MDDASDEAGRRKVHELIEGIDVALVTTRASGEDGLHARPMVYQAVEDDGDLWFFTRAESRKVAELRADPATLVCFADPRKHRFVTLSGTGEIVSDPQEKTKRWSEAYRPWFPGGPQDEAIVLLHIRTTRAEYWDTPTSAVVYAFGYVRALATGKPSRAGEIGAVDLA